MLDLHLNFYFTEIFKFFYYRIKHMLEILGDAKINLTQFLYSGLRYKSGANKYAMLSGINILALPIFSNLHIFINFVNMNGLSQAHSRRTEVKPVTTHSRCLNALAVSQRGSVAEHPPWGTATLYLVCRDHHGPGGTTEAWGRLGNWPRSTTDK